MTYVLETVELCKEFRGFRAVSNVSIKVRKGDIHALIGPNGAGKTTVFNLLTKFLEPTSGTILLEGRDITREKPALLARQGMVRSFQISATFPHLTVLENVRVALQRKSAPTYAFWLSGRVLRRLDERAMELLELVDMQDFAGVKAADLPYGRKRSVEIATTMAMEPRLMLLDEPTQGMGHEDVERVTQLIKRVSAHRTILMVEHNMKVVAGICDRISVLQRGSILAEGSYAEISSDPRVLEAYMGTAAEPENAGGVV
ncbi:ABC transporter ATP-binding protein [Rhizobium sp. ARZ01]|uniref:ABC transporter ATP-binding protein n=1 Tax=Rhizobium sp. ARZ01 TaxID=2769313 RepID=UPI0017820546|nr:ABC transporter ATP-binding protein [Rhizobium sp. ARZ01]MBD9375713.1 ABC transporter ATP-binding protein [Rhizobium sp. ARZ01]